MAINKVRINKEGKIETLIDLTQDTVTPETLCKGVTAHGADGEPIVGTMEVVGSDDSVWVEDDSRIVFTKNCYQNGNILMEITENGTCTYKRTYRKGENNYYPNHYPKWAHKNYNQINNYMGKNATDYIKVEQAEIVNLENALDEELIKTIGQSTFSCMSNLKRVRIPNTITTVEQHVFSYCISLENIELPNTVTTIENNVFQDCYKLKSFEIPPLVTTLGEYTFLGCYKLQHVVGIERMTSIGVNAFDYCLLLETPIVLNEAIAEIGNCTFRSCYSIPSVTFLGTPNSINANGFAYCASIKDIYVPWSEGEVANAPWGATNATIHYNTTYDENHNPIV